MTRASDAWKTVDWHQARKLVFQLQKRIFKAQSGGDTRRVRKLQRLLIRSRAARYLAVRQVTQLNEGKKTPGVDGRKALTPGERLKLVDELKGILSWKHEKLRRVWIHKRDGSQRPLGIPTIADRAAQCLVKLILEPAQEAVFVKDEAPSFGFRPGHCAHDAAQAVFKKLNGGNSKRTAKTRVILEADIEGCFNELAHEYILSHLLCDRKVKGVVHRMLKAGVKGEFSQTFKGATQGGVASPLLANLALHGIEKGMNMVRYADDFICVCATIEEAAARLETIKTRLALRGLKVKEAKTRIVKVTQGFDFLGWNFRWWGDNVFRIIPSKDNVTTNLRKLKEVRRKSLHLRPEDFLKKLNPIIRGWLNYHRFCGNRSKTDGRYLRTLWKQVERYLQRRGSFKSWKHYREFWRPKFAKAMVTTGNVPTRTWIKVQKGRSVYDGDTTYWSQRNSALYDNFLSKALKKQKFKCGHCGLAFYPGESIELHHQDGNPNNGKANNLVALHRGCHQHQEIHSEARKTRTRAGTV